MKKSLIALAVAGAFAAPAFAATSNVDVYGVMNIAIQDTNEDDRTPGVVDNVSRIGFKGTEDLGGGLKAVWQIESAIGGNGSPTAGIGGGSIGTRNTFIGLAGGFGTVLMGRHDTPYKLGTVKLDIFGDTIADYNTGRLDQVACGSSQCGVELISNSHDARVANALAYVSPTWSGFHFAAAVVMSGGKDDETFDATSLTAVYENGPFFGSLSYQNVEAADSDAWKLGLGYSFGDTKLGFVYENVDKDPAYGDRDSWLLNVAHGMGPMTLKAQYGRVDAEDLDTTEDMWALGLDYSLSKRTTAYVVFANGDDDVNDDVAGWNIGVKHTF